MGRQSHVRLRLQCSPQHSNSAFFPFTGQLQLAARIERDDEPEQKLEKLEAIVRAEGPQRQRSLSLFGTLLGLPVDRYSALSLSPAERKEETVSALVAELTALSAREPVLIVFEDAHWIDPTSQEALDALVDAARHLPALIVVTHRPEFASRWRAHGHVTELTLNRLPSREGASIIGGLTGDRALPDDVRAQVLEKSDGIPLFIEELTRTALEGGLLRETDALYVLEGTSSELAIPSALHGSLMARLDRNPAAKEIAQIGACIGREFSFELLSEVVLSGADLADALEILESDQIIFRRGAPPEAIYTFKHALVQGVAYDSLLRQTRRDVHARIAQVVDRKFSDLATQQPEVVALHAAEGGLPELGARYRLAAASLASERSAVQDMVAHLSEALRLVDMQPDGDERTQQQLDILVRLGTALVVQKGYSAPEVETAYRRARVLAERLGARDKLFATTWGLWLINQTRSRYAEGQRLAEELLEIGHEDNDPALMLEAHHSAWTTLSSVPKLAECLAHTEQGIALYDVDAHRDHKFIYAGHDPGVCGYNHQALMLWLLGYPDRAKRQVRESLRLARSLEHGPSEVTAEAFAAWVYQFGGEADGARAHAGAAIVLSEEKRLSPQLAFTSRVILGWALVVTGHVEEGFATAWRGLEQTEAIAYRIRRPYLLGVLADACLRSGRIAEGLEVVRESLSDPGGMWVAEVQRLRGELLIAAGEDNSAGETALRSAYERAEAQGARSLQLRAGLSLARLLRRTGRGEEARRVLGPVYDSFTEGFGTSDLIESRELLRDLS